MVERPDKLNIQALRHDDAFSDLRKQHILKFGIVPSFYVSAPGRVNLIGEHVDYNGFAVLPCALELSAKMSVSYRIDQVSDNIVLANTNPKFPSQTLPSNPSHPVHSTLGHDWSGYFHCGYKGVFDYVREHNILTNTSFSHGIKGLSVLVSGDIPCAAGLSSSSALVVASALVTSHILQLNLSRGDLASLTIRAERYIGTMGGGMDQAASIYGETGSALFIEFIPQLKVSCVKFPASASLVVCNSLVESEKSVDANFHYNKRVVECRLASLLLAKNSNIPQWEKIKTLKELEIASNALSLRQLAELADFVLRKDAYSKADLTRYLGCDIYEIFANEPKVMEVLNSSDEFWLRNRAVHVFLEAQRVLDFKNECEKIGFSRDVLPKLGALMDSSHSSCRDLFDCSCSELEELVLAAKNAGALGSRLTGAGWGGCAVSLVENSQVDKFIDTMKAEFYKERHVSGVLFSTQPACGAAIYNA